MSQDSSKVVSIHGDICSARYSLAAGIERNALPDLTEQRHVIRAIANICHRPSRNLLKPRKLLEGTTKTPSMSNATSLRPRFCIILLGIVITAITLRQLAWAPR